MQSRVVRKKGSFGFLVVMVGSPNFMTKRNSHQFLNFLVTRYSVKQT